MMRAYYISIWPVHAGLPKSQVSSLKSQVSTRSGLPKSQVSSLKYLSVFFIFFSFHDKSNCVYSRPREWMRRPRMILMQPAKRATVKAAGPGAAAADRAERPRCPSAWLAGSRTRLRTSCGINTAGGVLPATPWCRILSRQRRARSRILGWRERTNLYIS